MATPAFWFKFDETSGQYATDSVSGLQAKMYDSTAGDRGVTFGSGVLNCDGSAGSTIYSHGALVEESSYATTPPTTFTLACRFKTSTAQAKPLVCYLKDGGSTQQNMAIVFWYNNNYARYQPAFHAWRSTTLYTGYVVSMPVANINYNDGEEHSVVVTADASGLITKMYVDSCDSPAGTYSDIPDSWDSEVYRWRLGGGGDGLVNTGAFNGIVDDIRYWTRVLTPTEICTFMAGGDPDTPSVTNALMFSCNT